MDVLEGVLPAEATTLDNFDEVVRIYQSRVYRLLLMHTGNPDAAEELTQECFVRAYRTRNRYRGESSLFTWLARIAINLAHDRARSPVFDSGIGWSNWKTSRDAVRKLLPPPTHRRKFGSYSNSKYGPSLSDYKGCRLNSAWSLCFVFSKIYLSKRWRDARTAS